MDVTSTWLNKELLSVDQKVLKGRVRVAGLYIEQHYHAGRHIPNLIDKGEANHCFRPLLWGHVG